MSHIAILKNDLFAPISFGGGGGGGGGGNVSVKTKTNPSVKVTGTGIEVCATVALPGFKVDGCITVPKGDHVYSGIGGTPTENSRIAHDAAFERNGSKGPR